MSEELKPCPFCGEIPVVNVFNDGYFDYARISCCHLMFEWCGYNVEENLKNAWNRRYQPENKPLTMEQLRQMDGEPVWVNRLTEPNKYDPRKSGWHLIWSKNIHPVEASDGGEEIFRDGYGVEWIAYKYKRDE